MSTESPTETAPEDSFDDFLRAVARAPAIPTGDPGVLAAGTLVDGKLRIESMLGRGGMGVVYLARHLQLDRQVALKLTLDEPSPRARARILAEAQAMARLTHDNVITVYDVGTVGDRIYIAMEHIDGGTARAWCAAKPRSWREILDVYTAAGNGLAAAHDAHLVHRDFKPDNVLVAHDGRVRVCDFGVVRRVRSIPRAQTSRDTPQRGATPLDAATDARPTAKGLVVGTLHYMAPEQRRDDEVDPRSDQYSFCVALFEALWGQRPFPTPASSDDAQPELVMPPHGGGLPRHVRGALRRGLSADPAARFDDMRALLRELTRERATRRRPWALGLATAGLAVAAAFAMASKPEGPCTHSADELAEVWGPTRASELARAFAATGMESAPRTWQRVQPGLDAYAAAWIDAHREACEATLVRGAQSSAAMDLRMRCLNERADALAALVDRLADADAGVVVRAAEAMQDLPPVGDCADAQALGALDPIDADKLVPGRRIQATIARSKANLQTGKYRAAETLAQAAVVEAQSLGVPLYIARAQAALAGAHEGLHAPAAAHAAATQGLEHAIRARDDVLAADLSIKLACLEGSVLQRPDVAQARLEQAAAWLDRLDHPAALDLELTRCEGNVAHMQGRMTDAITALERGVALANEHDVSPLVRLRMQAYLAMGLRGVGRLEEARRIYADLLVALERAGLDQAHPYYATQLLHAGNTERDAGNLERARELLQRSLDARTEAFGENNEAVLEALHSLAAAHRQLGDSESAIALEQRGAKILETFTPSNPQIEIAFRVRLAMGAGDTRGPRAALDAYEALWQRTQEILPAGDRIRLSVLANAASYANAAGARQRALALARTGVEELGSDPNNLRTVREFLERQQGLALLEADPAAALDAFARALAAIEGTELYGQHHFHATLGRARALVALDRAAEAIPVLDAALAVEGQPTEDVGRAWLTLAQARRATGDEANARRAAERVLELELEDADLVAAAQALLDGA